MDLVFVAVAGMATVCEERGVVSSRARTVTRVWCSGARPGRSRFRPDKQAAGTAATTPCGLPALSLSFRHNSCGPAKEDCVNILLDSGPKVKEWPIDVLGGGQTDWMYASWP